MDRHEILHDPRHLGVPSGASKMISELTVCLAQTVHLSWIKISTISKRTEISFHLSLVTKEYDPEHSQWFLRLWYVWCKLWYLAPTLTLSTNRPKQDSTWPTSPRSSIRCVHNDFWVYSSFGANCAPILNQDELYFQTDQNELPFERHHLGVPSGVSKTIFWAYGTFGTNCAPIMHRNWHYLQKDQNEILHDPRHPGVPSGASKLVSEAMVRLVQTMYLSCTETNTISIWTERRFYMTHVT
jgi:hypothetical protein